MEGHERNTHEQGPHLAPKTLEGLSFSGFKFLLQTEGGVMRMLEYLDERKKELESAYRGTGHTNKSLGTLNERGGLANYRNVRNKLNSLQRFLKENALQSASTNVRYEEDTVVANRFREWLVLDTLFDQVLTDVQAVVSADTQRRSVTHENTSNKVLDAKREAYQASGVRVEDEDIIAKERAKTVVVTRADSQEDSPSEERLPSTFKQRLLTQKQEFRRETLGEPESVTAAFKARAAEIDAELDAFNSRQLTQEEYETLDQKLAQLGTLKDAAIAETKGRQSVQPPHESADTPAAEASSAETQIGTPLQAARLKWKGAREVWAADKASYEDALKKHHAAYAEWSKNMFAHGVLREQPLMDDLAPIKQKYIESRQHYIATINDGLNIRSASRSLDAQTKWVPTNEALRTMLANRFVIGVAEQRLAIQKEAIAAQRPEIVKKVQTFIADHRKGIKYTLMGVSLAATFGLTGVSQAMRKAGTVIGGAAGAGLNTVGLALSFGAAGALAGGFIGNQVMERFHTGKRRMTEAAARNDAKTGVTVDRLEELENAVFNAKRDLARSESLKKGITVTAAVAGGVAGAGFGGGFDSDAVPDIDTQTDTIPPAPTSTPEPTPVPEIETIPSTSAEISPDPEGDTPLPSEHAPDPVEANPSESAPLSEAETDAVEIETVPTPSEPAAPMVAEPAPRIPVPIVPPSAESVMPPELPADNVPPADAPAASLESAPEESADTTYEMYTVQKGDTLWDLLEGDIAGRDMSSVLASIPEEHRKAALDQLFDRIDAEPELLDAINISSGRTDLIYHGEEINVTALNEQLYEIAKQNGYVSDGAIPPVPEVDIDKEVAPRDVAPDAATEESVPTIAPQPGFPESPYSNERDVMNAGAEVVTPSTVNEMNVLELISLWRAATAETVSPETISQLQSLGIDADGLNDVIQDLSSRGPGDVMPQDYGLTLQEYINKYEVEQHEPLEATPQHFESEPPSPASADAGIREASLDAADAAQTAAAGAKPLVAASSGAEQGAAAVDAVVQSIEKKGGFFWGENTIGTFDVIQQLSRSDVEMLNANPDQLAQYLKSNNISVSGWDDWMTWLQEKDAVTPANDQETLAQYVARITRAGEPETSVA